MHGVWATAGPSLLRTHKQDLEALMEQIWGASTGAAPPGPPVRPCPPHSPLYGHRSPRWPASSSPPHTQIQIFVLNNSSIAHILITEILSGEAV